MAKPRTAKEVLRAALNLIENVGWVQGTEKDYATVWDDQGDRTDKVVGYCAIGAIKEIDGPAEHAAAVRLARHIVANTNSHFWDRAWYPDGRAGRSLAQLAKEDPMDIIVTYNDAAGTRYKRTKKQVVEMFKGAIGED